MSRVSFRNRLCEEILGGNLSIFHSDSVSMSLPINYSDVGPAVLRSAQEAVYEMSPNQVRQTLPFVLHAIECNRTNLFETGYISSFLLHINNDFYLSQSTKSGVGPDYSSEYRRDWVAPTVSAMNKFEHGWALAWVIYLLENGNDDALYLFERYLIMFSRILSMALDKAEYEAPSLQE